MDEIQAGPDADRGGGPRISVAQRFNAGSIAEVRDLSLVELQQVDRRQLSSDGYALWAQRMFKSLGEKTQTRLGDSWNNLITKGPKTEVQSKFEDVPCPRATAVKVKAQNSFLHANKITLKLPAGESLSALAAMAPTADTYELFWNGVMENGNTVVDLRRETEGELQYFPEKPGQSFKFGDVTVHCLSNTDAGQGLAVQQYTVKNDKTGQQKVVTRCHFTNWPDHQGLNETSRDQVQRVAFLAAEIGDSKEPPIIHCRAGLGRTGTYIAQQALVKMHESGTLTAENVHDAIDDIVMQLREQRGPDCVQDPSQLETLYRFADDLIENGPPQFRPEIERGGNQELVSAIRTVRLNERVQKVGGLSLSQDFEIGKEGSLLAARRIFSQKGLLPDDVVVFDRILKDLVANKLTGKLSAGEAKELGAMLRNFKLQVVALSEMAKTADNESGYMVVGMDSDDEENEVADNTPALQGLTKQQNEFLNFALSVLDAPVPAEVLKHDAYCPSVFSMGHRSMKAAHLDGRDLAEQARSHGWQVARAAHSLDPTQTCYLLRPSTTRGGVVTEDQDIQPFTLIYRSSGKLEATRLAFNGKTERWQFAQPDGKNYDWNSGHVLVRKGAPKSEKLFKLLSSQFSSDELARDKEGNILNNCNSLETLIGVSLLRGTGNSDARCVTEQALAQRCLVEVGGEELFVPVMFFKAMSELARDITADATDTVLSGYTMPGEDSEEDPRIHIPKSACSSPRVFEAFIEHIGYGSELRFESPMELEVAWNFAHYLGLESAAVQLLPALIRIDKGHVANAGAAQRMLQNDKKMSYAVYNNGQRGTQICVRAGNGFAHLPLRAGHAGGVAAAGQGGTNFDRLATALTKGLSPERLQGLQGIYTHQRFLVRGGPRDAAKTDSFRLYLGNDGSAMIAVKSGKTVKHHKLDVSDTGKFILAGQADVKFDSVEQLAANLR